MPVVELQETTSISQRQGNDRAVAAITYFLAFCLGVGLVAYTFPARVLFATDVIAHPILGIDASIHAVGQRYFVKDSWHWPPLLIKSLAAPEGTNVAYTDSIPLMALLMKLFRHFLPPGFQTITLWLGICWILQPLSAVFALRSAGEKRILPNLAVALIAISLPTLIYRVGHAALCSHFLILLALGLYFQITRTARNRSLIVAGLLVVASLLINPYIMYMVIAVLVAAPLSLLLRRDPAWIRVSVGIGIGIVFTAALTLILGYGHTIAMDGFGVYSMNLLSPIYPSTAMIGQPGATIDATTGQYEGYQFLGVGLILLILIADFSLSLRDRIDLLKRHAGLVLACIGLFLLALSNKIYAGHLLLVEFPAPSWIVQVRSSGRMFWPVAYAAIIVSTLIVCQRLNRRWVGVLLLVLAAMQYVETSPMRRWIRHRYAVQYPWAIDPAEFRPLLATHTNLMVWPKFGCGGDQNRAAFSHLFLLASEVGIRVNTTYTGRLPSVPDCDLPEFPIVVKSSDMWVFVPNGAPTDPMSIVDWRDICREISGLVVCAQDLRSRKDLPLPTIPSIPVGTTFPTITAGAGDAALVGGWFPPEVWGVWGEGGASELIAKVVRPAGEALVFTAVARGVPPSNDQKVTVVADGVPVATWDVRQVAAEYKAVIPAAAADDAPVKIEFQFANSFNPPWLAGREIWFRSDRKIGMGLTSFRFDPVAGTSGKSRNVASKKALTSKKQ